MSTWGDEPQPAFPSFEEIERYDEDRGKFVGQMLPVGGMSLRDYFAAKALLGMLASFPADAGNPDKEGFAVASYMFADAMLKAREGK